MLYSDFSICIDRFCDYTITIEIDEEKHLEQTRSWAIDPNKKESEFRNFDKNPRQEVLFNVNLLYFLLMLI